MRVLPLVLLLCACGRISFDPREEPDAGEQIPDASAPDGSAPDAAAPDGSAPDASAPDAGPVYASGPFGPPVEVTELSSALEDDDPSLTADMLEIYFKTDRDGDNDVYRATRTSVDDRWSAPSRVDELSSSSNDNTPEVSFDGLTIHLASDRGGGGVEIYRSTRASRSDPWEAPVRVDELSSSLADLAAAMDEARLALVMTRLDAAATDADLFVANRATVAEPWSAPVAIDELNTMMHEADAVLDTRGLLLFFTRTAGGTGGRDLVLAERPTVDAAFGAATPLTELNTDELEEDPWISPDLSVIYFSRQTSGERNIYRATRPL